MPDILLETTIESTPDKVYKALTEQDGIASWWTTQTKAEPKVGAVNEMGFSYANMVMKMEVTKLEAGKTVNWKPIHGAPDWPGTRVTWDLDAVENGTKVLLGHRDYASTQGSFAGVAFNWAYFMISLKAYLETGKGTPAS